MTAMIRLATIVLICAVCAIGMVSLGWAAHPGMRDVLPASPECSPPCFLGIQPGDTFYPDAVKVLQSHPWVSQVIISSELRNTATGFMFLNWSGEQPDAIATQLVTTLWIDQGTIEAIRIPTRIPLGWFWLDARPPLGTLVRLSERSYRYFQPLEDDVSLTLTLVCPFNRSGLWRAEAELRFGSMPAIEPRYVVEGYPRAQVCLRSP